MQDPSGALQKALYAVLSADAALTAITGGEVRVFDRVPVDRLGRVMTAAYPFVQLGGGQVLDDSDGCADGADTEFEVHAWSRAVGQLEAKRMTDRIAQVCDVPLEPEGHEVVVHEVVSIRAVLNPDGLTTHRVVTLRYLTNPTS